MTISQSMALLKIMEIVSIPGEISNDGECLDMIIALLEELGLPVKQEIERMRRRYEEGNFDNIDESSIEDIIEQLQGE